MTLTQRNASPLGRQVGKVFDYAVTLKLYHVGRAYYY